jgi:acyl-CoA synthetase (NDP forming)
VRETGDGDTLEAALVEAAGGMRILGPNCYGFLNLLDGAALWPDIHGAVRADGAWR